MEKKRTRAWRRYQARRVFKARLKYVAAIRNDQHVTWKDLRCEHGVLVYKTTGTPCSCWLCRGEKYNRKEYKRSTRRIINESMEQHLQTQYSPIHLAELGSAFLIPSNSRGKGVEIDAFRDFRLIVQQLLKQELSPKCRKTNTLCVYENDNEDENQVNVQFDYLPCIIDTAAHIIKRKYPIIMFSFFS